MPSQIPGRRQRSPHLLLPPYAPRPPNESKRQSQIPRAQRHGATPARSSSPEDARRALPLPAQYPFDHSPESAWTLAGPAPSRDSSVRTIRAPSNPPHESGCARLPPRPPAPRNRAALQFLRRRAGPLCNNAASERFVVPLAGARAAQSAAVAHHLSFEIDAFPALRAHHARRLVAGQILRPDPHPHPLGIEQFFVAELPVRVHLLLIFIGNRRI